MLDKDLLPETEVSPWAKEAIEKLKGEKSMYATKAEAISAFTNELNEIALKRSMTVEDLLRAASASVDNHADFDRAIRLSSLIYSFKNS